MRLGQLADELQRMNPTHEVVIAWPEGTTGRRGREYEGKYAGCLTSYRGYYDQIAITPSKERRTVADLRRDVLAALNGQVFEGWKGGDYVMGESTAVWLADRGDATDLGIGALIQAYESVCITAVDVSDYQGW